MNVKQLIAILKDMPPDTPITPGELEFIASLGLKPDDGSTPRTEVLAAIGEWTLAEAHGNVERTRKIFEDTVGSFVGQFPHHKILTHLCEEAGEWPDEIGPYDFLQK